MSPNDTLSAAIATCLLCLAATSADASTPPAPAKVMLVGTFHFANPGRDMVKSGVIDVTTKANQAYLDGLATRLAAFQPTDVLVECSPTDQGEYDAKFKDYVAGNFALPANENYQLGFRVAKAAGIAGVTCFDEDTIGWEAEPMFAYIEKNEPATRQALEAIYATLSADADREQSTLSLPQLLRLHNDPARDAFNKGLYLRTNDVDAGGGFAGADASASWWHRNFRMYANIQKAAAPGHRVIAVAGQGHTAILKDLLADDSQRQGEDVVGYLELTR
jgi:Family of unknown function (DUF5694)